MVHLACRRFFMWTSIDNYRSRDLLQKEMKANETAKANTRSEISSANASVGDGCVPQVDQDSKEPFLANLEGMFMRSEGDDGGRNVQGQQALVRHLLLDYGLNC